MAYFPIFCDLTNKPVFVFGGNRHIYEKLQRLEPFGASVTVFCEAPLPEVECFPGIRLEKRSFREEDLDGNPVMVIASLEDREEERRISAACMERCIPVNIVDVPELCSFYFPSLIVEGDLTVGISTAGVCPTAAVVLKEKFRSLLPSNIASIITWTRQQRDEMPAFPGKRQYLRRIFLSAVEKNRPLTEHELEAEKQFSTQETQIRKNNEIHH